MDSELTSKVDMFMQAEMPQIKMHGGDWEITDFDDSGGNISIELDGACGGCSISPMTVEALKNRMPDRIDRVSTVSVDIVNDEEDVTDGPFA